MVEFFVTKCLRFFNAFIDEFSLLEIKYCMGMLLTAVINFGSYRTDSLMHEMSSHKYDTLSTYRLRVL